MGGMFHEDGDGLDFDRWHDDGGLPFDDENDEPLHERDWDDEPADIDDDMDFDPYAGQYDRFDDCYGYGEDF